MYCPRCVGRFRSKRLFHHAAGTCGMPESDPVERFFNVFLTREQNRSPCLSPRPCQMAYSPSWSNQVAIVGQIHFPEPNGSNPRLKHDLHHNRQQPGPG